MTPIENLKRRLIAEHGYKPSTEKGYVRVAERFLEHMATKAKDITQITQADVEEFRDLMANETVSKRRTGGYGMRDPASVARETAALNKFLSVLGKKDLKLKLTKVPIKELRIPTDDEVDAMIRAASENEDEFLSKRNVLILMLLADAGRRNGEVRELRLEDIDLKERKIVIRRCKDGNDHVIGITDATVEAIEAYLRVRPVSKDPHLIVTKTGRPMDHQLVGGVVHQAAAKAGVERNITPHQLRHWRLTSMSRQGSTVKEMQYYACHKSPVTTMRYDHTDEDRVAEEARRTSHFNKKENGEVQGSGQSDRPACDTGENCESKDAAASDIERARMNLAIRFANDPTFDQEHFDRMDAMLSRTIWEVAR